MTADKSKSDKKYLTEIKELPIYEEGASDAQPATKALGSTQEKTKVEPQQTAQQVEEKDDKEKINTKIVSSKDMQRNKEIKKLFAPSKKKIRKFGGIPFTTRDIILNVINLLTLILLFVILSQISSKAQQLKEVKNENLRLAENYNYDLEQVEEQLQQSEELNSLLTDEAGVIDFVSAVENLSESGAVRSVSFPNQDPVSDRSGSYGQPITINLRGTWSQIDLAIDNIHSLPYLFRPVKIEIEELDGIDGPVGQMEVKYGGLLYIKDPVNENETSE